MSSTGKMTTMEKYSINQHLKSYIYDLIDRNDDTILDYIDEQDIQDIRDYAMRMMEYMSRCKDDQERMDFLFEGILLYSIARRIDDNANR